MTEIQIAPTAIKFTESEKLAHLAEPLADTSDGGNPVLAGIFADWLSLRTETERTARTDFDLAEASDRLTALEIAAEHEPAVTAAGVWRRVFMALDMLRDETSDPNERLYRAALAALASR